MIRPQPFRTGKEMRDWYMGNGYTRILCPFDGDLSYADWKQRCASIREDGTCRYGHEVRCALRDPRVYGLYGGPPIDDPVPIQKRKPYEGGWNGRMIRMYQEYHEQIEAEKDAEWHKHPKIWDQWAKVVQEPEEWVRKSDGLTICKPVIRWLEREWWKILCDIQRKTIPRSGNDSWTDHRYVVWYYEHMEGFNDNYLAAYRYYERLEPKPDPDPS